MKILATHKNTSSSKVFRHILKPKILSFVSKIKAISDKNFKFLFCIFLNIVHFRHQYNALENHDKKFYSNMNFLLVCSEIFTTLQAKIPFFIFSIWFSKAICTKRFRLLFLLKRTKSCFLVLLSCCLHLTKQVQIKNVLYCGSQQSSVFNTRMKMNAHSCVINSTVDWKTMRFYDNKKLWITMQTVSSCPKSIQPHKNKV